MDDISQVDGVFVIMVFAGGAAVGIVAMIVFFVNRLEGQLREERARNAMLQAANRALRRKLDASEEAQNEQDDSLRWLYDRQDEMDAADLWKTDPEGWREKAFKQRKNGEGR